MEEKRKYVVRYQGGSGGFVVAWLLQLAINPELLNTALGCFPIQLRSNSYEWGNYEITPNQIGVHSNNIWENNKKWTHEQLIEQSRRTLTKISQSNTIIENYMEMKDRMRYYYNNYVFFRVNFLQTEKYKNQNFSLSSDEFHEITNLLFERDSVIVVNPPRWYIQECEKTKGFQFEDGTTDFCGPDQTRGFYINDILPEFQDKLMIFNTESIWNGAWQDEIESILSKKLSDIESYACQQLVKRWLYVSPKSIRDILDLA